VVVSERITPPYANTSFTDYVLFMPYSELHLSNQGKYDLKFLIYLYDPVFEREIARGGDVLFSITR
jgi:hypothetical protein